MATYIPAPLMDHIEATLGHNDYAPYVLDGQTADDDGDYHDVVTVVEAGPGRYGVSSGRCTRTVRSPTTASLDNDNNTR